MIFVLNNWAKIGNKDVHELNRNPSANDLDTIGTHLHGEANLKIMHGWHFVSFFCSFANGCYEVSCQVQVNSLSTSKNLKVEPNDIGTMDIFGDVQVSTTYRQKSWMWD
jgi:hypothetical protein